MAEYVRKRDKALSILTNGQVFDRGMRNVIVRVYPQEGVLGFRLKGLKNNYILPVQKCFMMALTADTLSKKKERKKKISRSII